ncbi:MAG: triose-phosphate isomerase [Candidatus Yonathbacteria bacterium RIFCSPLOWO2_01_FULL_47_33b]|uniref:Triosephosphate isomerase n=1 Tax=Candidatus Yonathbacteria bacterium RIFCSPLOWO2_01_FULL_47_33b TaxID=1802727 RepID=A0A1G2SH22_9BACT|nr:MAG: triose-phosphate isomerase [Candidatus Yonathbacteria bacterium RIFCSPLOWO2_01_FULL_47_33b]
MMKKIIIGNWKMYPASIKDAQEKFKGIKKVASTLRNVQTVICPPFVYVSNLKKLVTGHRCVVGAQNVWFENEGAFTGEVSPAMLASLKLTYVIIGHSERRTLGETDELVNKKVVAAVKAGLTVVLCVGETERDPDGEYLKHIAAQVKIALKGITKKDLAHLVIAYEPIWAIGKHALRAASTDDALEVAILIKKTLAELYSKEGSTVAILYGGSVDAKNAWEFLVKSHVDGLLVGRASLDPKVFGEILKSADTIK